MINNPLVKINGVDQDCSSTVISWDTKETGEGVYFVIVKLAFTVSWCKGIYLARHVLYNVCILFAINVLVKTIT